MSPGAGSFSRGTLSVVALALGLAGCTAGPSTAQSTAQSAPIVEVARLEPGRVLRIRDHRGGYLPRVVAQVNALNEAGVAGRIDGAFCFSACTVYLALNEVCVAPWTQFGFHAPRDPHSGRPLNGAAFEYATAHVARYYRPELSSWWMRQGRHVRNGMAFRTGAELIAMGYPACPSWDSARAG
ncbi:MAG: hypothetical protein ACXIUV_04765 [Alkalilacustris sp.]